MIKKLKNFSYNRELVEILLKSKLGSTSSNLVVPILVYLIFMDHMPKDVFHIWIALHFLVFIGRITLGNKILSMLSKIREKKLNQYLLLYLVLVFASALLWGSLHTFSFVYMKELDQYIALAIMVGLMSASTTVLSSVYHASFLFVSTIIVIMIFNFIYFGGSLTHIILSILMLIFAYVVLSANNKIFTLLKHNIDQRNDFGIANRLLRTKVQEVTEVADKKEELIQKQSALVQMGEMISMIAHQWRQPLGAIVAVSIDLKMQLELDTFDLEQKEQREACKRYFSDALRDIDSLVQNMTNTIDDFRNFYKPNKAHSITSVTIPINKAIDIVRNSFKTEGIMIIEKCDSTNEIDIYVNEMMQVILNILKNAQDNFKEKQIKNKTIIFSCVDIEDGVLVKVCDNGGGIDDDVIPKIFNPYFSTKDEKNGTGLGLYMSKIIIEEHHCGKLSVHNNNDGACFEIKLNKKINEQ